MLNIELKTKSGSIVQVVDAERTITKVVLDIEVSETDRGIHGGVPLSRSEVYELINALKAIV